MVWRRWAQLDAGADEPEDDSGVHKMAMNIGRRPSIEDGTDVTVEVHILHSFDAADFRGKRLRVVVGGFIRHALILHQFIAHASRRFKCLPRSLLWWECACKG